MKLTTHLVEKPWGRAALPPMFGPTGGRRIGEVWFDGPAGLPLLVKYIFTSERLSVQVHPSDQQARAHGLPSGKDECWYILAAEDGARLGLGLKREVGKDELRAAALDGSIEQLMEWRTVRAGDFFSVPAGTIHAIGPGISLLEVQQNADVTFRLYDYGRPRELHLDDAIAVADRRPLAARLAQHVAADETRILIDGPYFSLMQSAGGRNPPDAFPGRLRWIMPLDGTIRSGNHQAGPGECLLVDPDDDIDLGDGRVLIAAVPSAVRGLIG